MKMNEDYMVLKGMLETFFFHFKLFRQHIRLDDYINENIGEVWELLHNARERDIEYPLRYVWASWRNRMYSDLKKKEKIIPMTNEIIEYFIQKNKKTLDNEILNDIINEEEEMEAMLFELAEEILSADAYDVFREIFLDGKTLVEIGERRGVSKQAVFERKQRIVKALKTKLTEVFYEK